MRLPELKRGRQRRDSEWSPFAFADAAAMRGLVAAHSASKGREQATAQSSLP